MHSQYYLKVKTKHYELKWYSSICFLIFLYRSLNLGEQLLRHSSCDHYDKEQVHAPLFIYTTHNQLEH